MTRRRKRSWRDLDPEFQQQMEAYGQAIPSRAYILSFLEEEGMPLTWEALCEAWELGAGEGAEWEVEALRRRLRAMERDGQLIRNRRGGYGVVSRMDLVKGRVVGHPDGFGFLVPEEGGDDLYIAPREMRKLLHGDRVVMRVAGIDRRGRREGALVEVLERNTRTVVGRYFEESGVGFVVSENKRISQDIVVPPGQQGPATAGQIVVAELIEQPGGHGPPLARVREVLGDHMAPGMEIEVAIASYGIPTEWPETVVEEAGTFSTEVPVEAAEGRVDLRALPLVTIDGATARDFDDAVYCERRGQNWRLVVAIADVSAYVAKASALDTEAASRGNSVYFPDRVVPMLPEVLSNGLCSLNPDVDRLCLVCDMTISPEGRIVRSRFMEGIMRSAARLTYDTVSAIVETRQAGARRRHGELVAHLDRLYGLFQTLRDAREARGAIDFDTQETEIEYGPERKIERIVPSQRNDAHRIIEECMIAANVAAARFLQRHKVPALYRVHDGPSAERLEKLRGFLGELGLGLGGGDDPTPKDYARLVEQARDRPDFQLIQTVMLRSLAQAVYSPDNAGHFGLAHEAYAHFTSPIRRYPDLLVHRGIRHVLRGGKGKDFPYSVTEIGVQGEHCSMTERRADEATRDAVEWLKCEFMLDKVGEEFHGVVAGVTGFGLFVDLAEVFVTGLVHITALPNDYYHFEPVGHRLRGERAGRVYRLGDTLKVKVMRVDLDERKIDFELAGAGEGSRPRRGRRGRRKG